MKGACTAVAFVGLLALTGCAAATGVTKPRELTVASRPLPETYETHGAYSQPTQEQEEAERREAWREVAHALQSMSDDMQGAANAYGNAARSTQPPPAPPAQLPTVTFDPGYVHAPAPHGCIGLAPVPGPGLNPCPS